LGIYNLSPILVSVNWKAKDIPDQSGKAAIVSGANSGIGYEAAEELAARGAKVILACRSEERGMAAAGRIADAHPGASAEYRNLDLADLSSVREFAAGYSGGLDLLINNAGIMALPKRLLTKDGFEMQFGTNHLGHFALTGLLLPAIRQAPSARIVNVSSQAHRRGKVDFDDLNAEKSYGAWSQYGLSKLCNLLFTYELGRRLKAASIDAISVAAHPGYTATNLQDGTFFRHFNSIIAQSAAMGALPTLYAATSADVAGGDYYGPKGFYQMWGHPKKVDSTPASHDPLAAKRLWEESERMTGVSPCI